MTKWGPESVFACKAALMRCAVRLSPVVVAPAGINTFVTFPEVVARRIRVLTDPICGRENVRTRPANSYAFAGAGVRLVTGQMMTVAPDTVVDNLPVTEADAPYLSPSKSSPAAMSAAMPLAGPRATILKASSTRRWPPMAPSGVADSADALANARAVALARLATTR